MYRPLIKEANLAYLLRYFLTKKGKRILELASPGWAGRNKTLWQKLLENSILTVPTALEQQKIASFLSTVDEKIEKFKAKKTLLEEYKKWVVQKIFSREIQFKNEDEKDFGKWEERKLGDLLNYEQPTNYLVKNKEYNDSYNTPVLTAGKTFILWYTDETDWIFQKWLPVIIFDDFTTASQFVDFPFKTKSSAMKILHATEWNDIKFLFELLQQIQFKIGGHWRHWISVFAEMLTEIATLHEKQKSATSIPEIDKKIEVITSEIKQTEKWKKWLLQQMFV